MATSETIQENIAINHCDSANKIMYGCRIKEKYCLFYFQPVLIILCVRRKENVGISAPSIFIHYKEAQFLFTKDDEMKKGAVQKTQDKCFSNEKIRMK